MEDSTDKQFLLLTKITCASASNHFFTPDNKYPELAEVHVDQIAYCSRSHSRDGTKSYMAKFNDGSEMTALQFEDGTYACQRSIGDVLAPIADIAYTNLENAWMNNPTKRRGEQTEGIPEIIDR